MVFYKRVILVTGGNAGIGSAIVESLAEKGHRVYLGARNEKLGQEAQAKLAKAGYDVKFVLIDVTKVESVAAAKEVIEKAEGHLDSLVNNAGVGLMHNSAGALAEPITNVRETMEVNLYGVMNVSQAFVPLLRRAPRGQACIVNVTTTMGSNSIMAGPDGRLHSWIAYNTSKAAANSYTIALAKELQGKIKVNAVEPGFVTSKLNGFAPGGKTYEQGAAVIVPWALLGPEDDDKTCIVSDDTGPLTW